MNQESYPFKINLPHLVYTFVSVGRKGEILKAVGFQAINNTFYNLVLGDYEPITGEIDDQIISNNGDLKKIFSTIIQITIDFLHKFPNKLIYIEANNRIKHELYTRIIKNNLTEIRTQFEVFGVLEDEQAVIFKENENYTAFIIQKKEENNK